MKPYINRYAFTDYGPAMIWSQEKLSTAKARRIFKQHGLEVQRFARNWVAFVGWVNVIEIHI
jgi:hypothetical protein